MEYFPAGLAALTVLEISSLPLWISLLNIFTYYLVVGVGLRGGYTLLVKPHSNRCRGYYMRRYRTLYEILKDNYRYGLRESTFGSISNEFGDRLEARRLDTTAKEYQQN